jgi:hypothetical protein
MTDDERIAAIEARLEAHANMVPMGDLTPDAPHPDAIVHERFYSTADALDDVPYLLARLREAERERDEHVEARKGIAAQWRATQDERDAARATLAAALDSHAELRRDLEAAEAALTAIADDFNDDNLRPGSFAMRAGNIAVAYVAAHDGAAR